MGALRHFAIVEGLVLLALLAVACVMGAYGLVDSLRLEQSLLSPTDSARLVFAYTFVIGLAPAMLFGGPAYFGLARLGKNRWPYVLAAGLVPGALAAPFEPSLAAWVALCGAAVALVTHGLHRKVRP